MGGGHSHDAYESAFMASHRKIACIESGREMVNDVCSNKTSVELLNLTLIHSMLIVSQMRTPAAEFSEQCFESIRPGFIDFCAKQDVPAREPTVNAFFDKAVTEQKETFWQSVARHHKFE